MTKEEFLKREEEIRFATEVYPTLEVGQAYARWKEERKERATSLNTGDKSVEQAKQALRKAAKKLCTQQGCEGIMVLEGICNGCVEGKVGYKSKWTCEKCLHRELSKKDYWEWLKELSGSLSLLSSKELS